MDSLGRIKASGVNPYGGGWVKDHIDILGSQFSSAARVEEASAHDAVLLRIRTRLETAIERMIQRFSALIIDRAITVISGRRI